MPGSIKEDAVILKTLSYNFHNIIPEFNNSE